MLRHNLANYIQQIHTVTKNKSDNFICGLFGDFESQFKNQSYIGETGIKWSLQGKTE